jgi:hypothetical protein
VGGHQVCSAVLSTIVEEVVKFVIERVDSLWDGGVDGRRDCGRGGIGDSAEGERLEFHALNFLFFEGLSGCLCAFGCLLDSSLGFSQRPLKCFCEKLAGANQTGKASNLVIVFFLEPAFLIGCPLRHIFLLIEIGSAHL